MSLSWLSSKLGGNFKSKNNDNDSSGKTSGITSSITAFGRSLSKSDLDVNDQYDNNAIGILSSSSVSSGNTSGGSPNGHTNHSNTQSLSSSSSTLDMSTLSVGARELIDVSLEPFVRTPSGCLIDHLVNLFGIGTDTNCYANGAEIYDRFHHPFKFIKFKAFTSACAIDNNSQWDRQYVDRVVKLTRQLKSTYPIGKSILSAIDKRYSEEGQEMMKMTGLYVPNDYLLDIVQDFSDLFIPCISIHPYRKDAIDELLKWIVKGVRFVRWLPISMGIDMSSELCVPFYEALVENDIILFVHVGNEHSLIEPPDSNSALGNPLLLKRALDIGVKIVGVHCGGEGKSVDFDDPKQTITPNLHLFLRLMHEKKYEDNLIGDLSGVIAYNRVDSLVPMLDHHYLHHRFIYSSDYPIPAVNLAVITTLLANRGLITPDERNLVNEIYKFNPILFDIVLKRIIRSPITGNRFNLSIFKENKFFESSIHGDFNQSNSNIIQPLKKQSAQQSPVQLSYDSPILDLVNLKDDDFELEEYTDF
ncbi:amidohydrolase 2 [Heterostelium album PN500]|uniref:Amidohydrolase 2 n=1 Tax=Heterostelium pallidum (strain ATCC 26659 / Pp 5 / PN500) TaxID=670386 RepID=D3BD84_HETP5|nr:amidohydrolase 2 [Heterostelium album PN500]EFA80876.1 amidohydrolase 2 [Heterostelium album PN500]|eukprot:XP_020432995.1 amidohydrolase 2 [Heterostelium album PN500]